jgi:hypothetical protein
MYHEQNYLLKLMFSYSQSELERTHPLINVFALVESESKHEILHKIIKKCEPEDILFNKN